MWDGRTGLSLSHYPAVRTQEGRDVRKGVFPIPLVAFSAPAWLAQIIKQYIFTACSHQMSE